ncbi:uncharacterized protein LOC143551503 [Bidens hawaiensis]|uniref:uncharacterized protein LOC143551503 n=1 Tax=Bidens hawaiensis TaxID=980011 RepID=UPI00404B59BB
MNNGLLLLKSNTSTSSLFQTPNSLFFHSHKTTHHSSSILLFPIIQLPKLTHHHVKLSSTSKTPTPETTDTFDIEEDDEFEEDEDEDEEDDLIVPLSNMRQWTRNKPRGFGEVKLYDTTLEDKLLEELEQSKAAQIANINNLKNNPIGNPISKLPKHKDPELAPNGIRMRLINLPKKKNIHRDLQAAFKPFTGIINIIPAVSGNEKTRDPVCKGFAFVDFKSEKDANRFVDIISTQPITFGKVQKQIRCEIMKPSSPTLAPVKPSVDKIKSPLPVLDATMSVNSNPVIETPYVEDDTSSDDDNDDDDDDELEFATDVVEEKHEGEVGSEALKKQKVREKAKKTPRSVKKVEKTPKLSIPGSAKRLKMKEKALLSGVFSKYGGKSSD